MKKNRLSPLLLLLLQSGLASLMMAGLASAQGGTSGTLVGLVSDPSGAVVPGVEVAVRSLETNITVTETTGEAGIFTFLNLRAGIYEVKAVKQGFRTATVSSVKLDVNATFRVNLTLQVGEVTQMMEVMAAAPTLQTDEAAVGHLIEQQRIVDLPLNGRNFQQLQLLTPGSVDTFNHQTSSGLAGGASALTITNVAVTANGARPNQMLFLIDGANTANQNGRGTIFSPNPDEIAEFKIQGSNFSAEYGYGSNVINVSTKSGTNEFHGAVWEFLRSDALDARNFFAPSVEPLKRNQFGGAIGGPVRKNRTFWFFNFEAQRETAGFTRRASVPTDRMRNGDLSELRNRIYDPATTRPDPNNPGGFLRDPFPGNIIPATRINSATKLFLDWIPKPNLSGINNNFVNNPNVDNDFEHYTGKVDHQINSSNSINFRYSFHPQLLPFGVGPYGGFSKPPYDPGTNLKDTAGTSTVLSWFYTLSPSTTVESRISFARAYNDIGNPNIIPGGTDWTTEAGIQGFGKGISDLYPTFPNLSYSGFTGLPGGGFALTYVSNNWDYTSNISMIRGKHTFKTGFSHRRWQQNLTTTGEGAGNFSFNGSATTNPASTAGTGEGFGDYLLGIPFTGGRYVPPGWYYQRMRNVWSYFQDDWKVSPKLTVNLGIRYEVNLPTVEKNDALASFDPASRNGRGAIVVSNEKVISPPYPTGHSSVPLSVPTYRPLIVTAAQAGVPERSLRDTDWKSFAPRFGISYRLTDKSVVRGGFGIFYVQLDGNRESEFESVPFLVREGGLLNTVVDGRPINTIQTFLPAGSSFAATPTLLAHHPRDGNFGYTEQWNLFVQRELPGAFVLDVGYVGTKGNKLQQSRALNTPLPGPGAVQPRRPFTDFANITLSEQSGNSIYHAMQAKLERRFTAGLTLMTSFTWSKNIDLNSGNTSTGTDPFNFSLDHGLADWDAPRVLSVSSVYQLPFFKEKKGVAGHVLGGWNVGNIVSVQDGYPFTPGWSGDAANTGRGSRPNRTCNGKLSDPTIARWFDTSCFGAPTQFTYGNSGRNILRGPGYFNWDMGLHKDFQLTEAWRLQFRSEFFNLFNHANFGLPQATINSGTPGVISTAALGRIIQFAFKLYF
jgi:hypothetical protein